MHIKIIPWTIFIQYLTFGFVNKEEVIKADVKETIENMTKACSIKTIPKTAYWYASERVSWNKNPGKNSQKNKVTFGLRRFIKNPFLKVLSELSSFKTSDVFSTDKFRNVWTDKNIK